MRSASALGVFGLLLLTPSLFAFDSFIPPLSASSEEVFTSIIDYGQSHFGDGGVSVLFPGSATSAFQSGTAYASGGKTPSVSVSLSAGGSIDPHLYEYPTSLVGSSVYNQTFMVNSTSASTVSVQLNADQSSVMNGTGVTIVDTVKIQQIIPEGPYFDLGPAVYQGYYCFEAYSCGTPSNAFPANQTVELSSNTAYDLSLESDAYIEPLIPVPNNVSSVVRASVNLTSADSGDTLEYYPALATTPEPGTFLTLGSGLLMGAGLLRRRRHCS